MLSVLNTRFDHLTNRLDNDIPALWNEISKPSLINRNMKFGPYSREQIVEKYPELSHIDFGSKNQDYKTMMCNRTPKDCGWTFYDENGVLIKDDCQFAHSYDQLGFFVEGKQWRERNINKRQNKKRRR